MEFGSGKITVAEDKLLRRENGPAPDSGGGDNNSVYIPDKPLKLCQRTIIRISLPNNSSYNLKIGEIV